jgi:CubicO group peptidase (beta-lactamase class C family)
MRKKCPAFLILFLLLQFVISCSSSSEDLLDEKISETLGAVAAKHELPGLAVAVFSSDTVRCACARGVRKKDSDAPLRESDRFHLGSNTKAILAYVAASLVEEGLIEWHTEFFDICPELREVSREEYYDITIHQLLTHTAGLVSKQDELQDILLPSTLKESRISREELFKWALDKERYRRGFQYSNTGYVMAAHMLERVADRDWKTLVVERVMDPLEIECAFGWPASIDTNQPWGHFLDPITQELVPHDPNDHFNLASISLDPAGDISMTVSDYIVFLQDNLKGFAGLGGILRPESYKSIHPSDGYGLGWGLVDEIMEYRNVSVHSGSAGTFYCQAFLFKEDDLGMIIFSNSFITDTQNIIYPLVREIMKVI